MTTTVLPVMTEGSSLLAAIASGKFQGVIPPTTPRGVSVPHHPDLKTAREQQEKKSAKKVVGGVRTDELVLGVLVLRDRLGLHLLHAHHHHPFTAAVRLPEALWEGLAAGRTPISVYSSQLARMRPTSARDCSSGLPCLRPRARRGCSDVARGVTAGGGGAVTPWSSPAPAPRRSPRPARRTATGKRPAPRRASATRS